MSASPKVTCFLPTRNRRAWLPSAIACFQLQTYANASLLIVADGERVDDLVPFDDPRITLISVPDIPLPADKFNLACSYAAKTADVLIKWDDDDWSAPHRVAEQLQLMERSEKAVVGYHSMLFTDGKGWWRYPGAPGWAFGTSLCFKSRWWEKNPFRSDVKHGIPIRAGSDNIFTGDAAHRDQIFTIDCGSTMVASIHGQNTSRRMLTSNPWVKVKDPVVIPGYQWPIKEGEVAA